MEELLSETNHAYKPNAALTALLASGSPVATVQATPSRSRVPTTPATRRFEDLLEPDTPVHFSTGVPPSLPGTPMGNVLSSGADLNALLFDEASPVAMAVGTPESSRAAVVPAAASDDLIQLFTPHTGKQPCRGAARLCGASHGWGRHASGPAA
jgi:hypothetical protein